MDTPVEDKGTLSRWKFTGAQILAQIRKGSRDLGIQDPYLPEDEAQECVLGVSFYPIIVCRTIHAFQPFSNH